MSSVIGSHVIGRATPLHAEGQPYDQKKHYIALLDNSETEPSAYFNEFEDQLSKLPLETVQALYLVLRDVFTPACLNGDRIKIVNYLLSAPQEDWNLILKQICFIMPHGTPGHDLAWAARILTAIPDHRIRGQLINTAHLLFKWDTKTVEKARILEALARLTLDQLTELDRAGLEQRDLFIQQYAIAGITFSRDSLGRI